MPISDYIAFAHRLADAAGDAIRPYFGQHGDVEAKGDNSPVTQADRAAEAAMRALIEATYPDHGIYGEEHGQTGLGNRYVWVLDPIDGTRAFIAGKKEWGTLIALCDNGVPVLGILNQPITQERWVGSKGAYSTYNGEAAQCYACTSLTTAETSSTYCAPPDDAAFARVTEHAASYTQGGDCYAYGVLAKGSHDLVADTALKPYDILALVPIIEGAGGIITGWDGAPLTLTHYAKALAAGNDRIHAAALAMLRV